MSTVENYALLRGQTNQKAQLANSKEELKAMIKQRELTIHQLSKAIEARRTEMKQQSKKISSLLDKKAKKHQKEVPQFGAQHLSLHLQKTHAEIQSVYRQTEEVKSQIRQIKDEQPEQIVREMEKIRSVLAELDRLIQSTQRNKELLKSELDANKDHLQSLRNNSCLIDLQNRQRQYEQVKRQCKQLEKEITWINAEQLPLNHYFHDLRQRVEKQFIQERIQTQVVDQREIAALIQDINYILQQRTAIERDSSTKIRQLLQTIAEIQRNNKELHVRIRECQNDVLRAGLESRRVTSYSTEPHQPAPVIKNPEKRVNPELKHSNKNKMVNKVYMMQREEENTIVVGSWAFQGKIFCDRGESWQIIVERARKIIFLISDGEIVGVRTVYSDKQGNYHEGRTILAPNIYSYSELPVSLDSTTSIQYRPHHPEIYLKFNTGQQGPQEIGSRLEHDHNQVQRISLDNYLIKWVEVQLKDKVVAIRLSLDDKPVQEKVIAQQVQQKTPATQRSFSNSTLGPRRVLLKGRSLTKLRQQPIIDHRLMLVKTKMV